MKAASAKQKGRLACRETKEMLLKFFPCLHSDDILVTSSGAPGEDLKLSPVAQSRLPLVFECKNQEKLNIWDAIKQAESHKKGRNLTPVVVFKRNRTDLQITLSLESFLELLTKRNPNPEIPDDHISEIHL